MNGRANAGLIVAAATAGIVLVALATATSMRGEAGGRSLACAYVSVPHEELELDSAADKRLGARTENRAKPSCEFAPEPPFGAEITILAVDEDGHPVPDAELHVHDPDQMDWDFESGVTTFEIDPLGEVRRKGTLAKCDERGRARIPRPSRNVAVLASAGELDGLDCLYPGAVSPWVVSMQRHHTLEVRVWDERGRPVADLPLELHESDTEMLWRGSTNGNGRAEIDSLAISLRWPDDVVVLTAAIPVDPPVESWLPRNFSSPRVVDLVIPSGSTTTLRIVDARGRVLDMNGDLDVYLPRDRPRADCETNAVPIPLKHGIATIRGIPRDCSGLLVVNDVIDQRIEPWPSGLWPPTIDIVMDVLMDVVRFAALDQEGRPLARRQLEWRQAETEDGKTESRLLGDGRLVTDASGVFSCLIRLERDPADDSENLPSLLELIDGAALPPLRALVPVESVRASTRAEPFAVRLSPVPLALSGRVLDESGAPVVDACITVESEVKLGEFEELETFAEAFTDASGRFAVFALPVQDPLTVKILIDGVGASAGDPAVTFAFGTSNVELRARTQATIEGRLVVDPDCRDRDFVIEAIESAQLHGDFGIWREGSDLHWRLRSLPAGVYQLRVLVDEELLCTIDDVHVPNAAVVLDPRCLPIDLRGRVPAQAPGSSFDCGIRALHLVDARGVSIDHGMWRYKFAGEWHSWGAWHGGEIQLLDAFERVAVWSPDMWLREGLVPERESTWALEPARLVELKLEVPAELRSSPLKFKATAELPWNEQSKLDSLFQHYYPVTKFDSSGRAVVQLPAAAQWQFVVVADWEVEGKPDGRELGSFDITLRAEPAFEAFKFKPNENHWLTTLRDADAPIAAQRD